MTNEELVEKVAEAMFDDYSNGTQHISDQMNSLQDDFRSMACAAIKITGEAILKNQIRNLHHISETHIKILTQGI